MCMESGSTPLHAWQTGLDSDHPWESSRDAAALAAQAMRNVSSGLEEADEPAHTAKCDLYSRSAIGPMLQQVGRSPRETTVGGLIVKDSPCRDED